MSNKILKYFAIFLLLPTLCWADVISIKEGAPQKYIVKQGDTLWDISNIYLEKPWLWPELWRKNVHIQNPHLIYPGDELVLKRNERGEVVLALVRETVKPQIKISPSGEKSLKMPEPIPALPWSTIKPFIENDQIMQKGDYEAFPYILGNQTGSVLFASNNLALTKASNSKQTALNVIRKQNDIYDMSGNFVGIQVRHVANAEIVDAGLDQQQLVRIEQVNYEVKRGDRLAPNIEDAPESIVMSAANEQRGFIIDDLEQHSLLGKFNVVILNLGKGQVSPGMFMGIYASGPNIIDDESPTYEGESNPLASTFRLGRDIVQPALKIGEVVIFKVFDKASYALITQSSKVITRGAIVAKP